jgi:hypothetical protein
MNILHVIRSLNPSTGGPPVVAACLATAQAGLGHSVSLAYTHPASGEDRAAVLLDSIPGADRIELLPIAEAGTLLATLPGLARRLRHHVAGRDMVHLHGVWCPILPLAARAAVGCKTPYVLTPHGAQIGRAHV